PNELERDTRSKAQMRSSTGSGLGLEACRIVPPHDHDETRSPSVNGDIGKSR
ncbi:unnamed protein product, partial [Amoebophrya sp. A120]